MLRACPQVNGSTPAFQDPPDDWHRAERLVCVSLSHPHSFSFPSRRRKALLLKTHGHLMSINQVDIPDRHTATSRPVKQMPGKISSEFKKIRAQHEMPSAVRALLSGGINSLCVVHAAEPKPFLDCQVRLGSRTPKRRRVGRRGRPTAIVGFTINLVIKKSIFYCNNLKKNCRET